MTTLENFRNSRQSLTDDKGSPIYDYMDGESIVTICEGLYCVIVENNEFCSTELEEVEEVAFQNWGKR
jgi:hypothetical protein